MERETKSLLKAKTDLEKVIGGLDTYVDKLIKTTEAIEDKQIELNSITKDVEIASREAKVELDLQVKENADGVLSSLLAERGLITITQVELDKIVSEAAEAKASLKSEVSKAIAIEKSKAERDYKVKVNEINLINARDKSELESELKAARKEIAFTLSALDTANKQIEANRQAQIEIASSSKAITVNTSNK